MTYALGAALLTASYWFGGWYWCLLYAAVVFQRCVPALAVPLFLVALFAITGDRRLFFPFALYQATVFGQNWRGGFAVGSSLIITLFTLIRIEQEASFRVIAVELIVAVIAAFAGWVATRRFGPVAGAITASVVALAGLQVN